MRMIREKQIGLFPSLLKSHFVIRYWKVFLTFLFIIHSKKIDEETRERMEGKKKVIKNLKYFRRCLGTLTSDILHIPPFWTNLLRIRREPIRGALKNRDERSRLSEVIKVSSHSITLVTAKNNNFRLIYFTQKI